MSKKATKSTKKQQPKTSVAKKNLLRASLLLNFTRQPKNTEERVELLKNMNDALESAYQVAKLMPTGTKEEENCLQGIRNLEDRRFELLSEIHGNQIQAYRWLTS